MAINFDFDGSLKLANQLETIADSIDAAATRRQGPRDTALSTRTFQGPYGNAHRDLAADEDAQLELAEACRTAAGEWATAWVKAVNDHNDEVYEDARTAMRTMNNRRVANWRFKEMNNFVGQPEPFPQLGSVRPPADATAPIGETYDPTNSIVRYTQSGVDLVPEYRSAM